MLIFKTNANFAGYCLAKWAFCYNKFGSFKLSKLPDSIVVEEAWVV